MCIRDRNTIVDLSRVGAQETKSLLMGILVMKLNEHRMAGARTENAALHHVTVLEEAHNLLKRCGMFLRSLKTTSSGGTSVKFPPMG